MVLIPPDVGVRMRMQTEASLHPVTPVTEIPADLVELRPGQAFSARIQEVLPENTYKALVAGRSLTLTLPEGAKAGDTLELVVIDRTPRLIVAQLANHSGALEEGAGGVYQFTNLSRTAQLIGSLLTRDGAPPPPAALTRGAPLIGPAAPEPGKLAAELVPQLARAVGQSGLFYEAHQVQWVMGQRPISDLMAEPQARHSPAELASANATSSPTIPGRTSEPSGPLVLLQSFFSSDENRTQAATSQPANPSQAVPEEIRPLVQQQLDAAATQRLAWHGEVWTGQQIDWQIEPDGRGSGSDGPESGTGWITSLRLTTPRLGEIDARLNLTPQGVKIVIAAPIGASAADLLDAAPRLTEAMAAAGVPLLSLQVKHEDGQ